MPADDLTERPSYPAARRLDLVEDLPAGDPRRAVADPYRWLEDASSPETAAWSAAQQELFAAARATWPARGPFARHLAELVATGSVGPPVHRGDRVFRARREPDGEHARLLVTEPDAAGGRHERVLVDPAALDPAGLTTLDSWSPSPDGALLAHQLSEGGREESALRIVDVATGEVVDGPIDRVRYSPLAWEPDGRHVWYVRRLDPALVPAGEEAFHRRVWRHRVGADPATDVEVFGAGQPITTYYGVSLSRDGRWLSVTASVGTSPRSDAWLGDRAAPDAADGVPVLRGVAVGLDGHTGAGVGRDGRLYVGTDVGAPRGRLAVADPTGDDLGPAAWRDLLPESADAVLEDWAVLDGDALPAPLLLVARTRHAISELALHDLGSGALVREVALPGLGSLGGLVSRREGGHEAWVTWTDTATPPVVLHLDARTGAVVVEARPPGAPAGAGAHDVRAEQVVATSADGTPVRMLVVSSADPRAAAGPRPTVLYGYGGFSHAMTPGYSASALAWVRAGGVWVVAGLRGGAEEGEEWHRAGMLGAKQNVFDDFAACADALVERGTSTPGQMVASGGSNGGLLVGAALTQQPGAWAGVLCSAPLLDMVRYQLHGLGATWSPEYGDAARGDDLEWLHAYSPYHRVVQGPPAAYPAVLFTVFDGDTRVDPLHARKTAAALQAASTSDPAVRPVLVRAEGGVGHGARSVSRTVELAADTLAFAAWCTGLDATGLDASEQDARGQEQP